MRAQDRKGHTFAPDRQPRTERNVQAEDAPATNDRRRPVRLVAKHGHDIGTQELRDFGGDRGIDSSRRAAWATSVATRRNAA